MPQSNLQPGDRSDDAREGQVAQDGQAASPAAIENEPPITTEVDLQREHERLIELQSRAPEQVVAAAHRLVLRGRRLGEYLADSTHRRECQEILTFWAVYVYRETHEELPAELLEFDPEKAPELDDAAFPFRFEEGYADRALNLAGWRRLLDEGCQHLARQNFLAVVGSSGSGRTVLVHKVLLPILRAGKARGDELAGSSEWDYYHVVPGTHPLEDLAKAVAGSEPVDPKSVRKQATEFRRDVFALRELLDRKSRAPAVLVVDSLGSVAANEGAESGAFFDNLYSLVADENSRHRVIVVIRRDRATDLHAFGSLEPAIRDAQLPMTFTTSELRRFVEEPSREAGLFFDRGVLDQVLTDVQGEPTSLPLLRITLRRLWKHRERNRITWSSYRKAGAGRAALEKAAEEVFEEAREPGAHELCRLMLLKMVRPETGGLFVTREADYDDLLACGDRENVDRLLQQFEKNDLIRDMSTPGHRSYRIRYEALLTSWPRLMDWLDVERRVHHRRMRLSEAAHQWDQRGRRRDLLWGGKRLQDYEETFLNDQSITNVEREFLQACRRRETAATWRRNIAIFSLAAAAVIVAIAWMLRATAEARATTAEAKATTAEAKATTAEAKATTAEAKATTAEAKATTAEAKARAAVAEKLFAVATAEAEAAQAKADAETEKRREHMLRDAIDCIQQADNSGALQWLAQRADLPTEQDAYRDAAGSDADDGKSIDLPDELRWQVALAYTPVPLHTWFCEKGPQKGQFAAEHTAVDTVAGGAAADDGAASSGEKESTLRWRSACFLAKTDQMLGNDGASGADPSFLNPRIFAALMIDKAAPNSVNSAASVVFFDVVGQDSTPVCVKPLTLTEEHLKECDLSQIGGVVLARNNKLLIAAVKRLNCLRLGTDGALTLESLRRADWAVPAGPEAENDRTFAVVNCASPRVRSGKKPIDLLLAVEKAKGEHLGKLRVWIVTTVENGAEFQEISTQFGDLTEDVYYAAFAPTGDKLVVLRGERPASEGQSGFAGTRLFELWTVDKRSESSESPYAYWKSISPVSWAANARERWQSWGWQPVYDTPPSEGSTTEELPDGGHWEALGSGVFHAAFDETGKTLATATEEGRVCFWENLREGVERIRIGPLLEKSIHLGVRVYHIEFLPGGDRFVTASRDRTARVWDLGSCAEIVPRMYHEGTVTVALSLGGDRLITNTGRAIRLWQWQVPTSTQESTVDIPIQIDERHVEELGIDQFEESPVVSQRIGPEQKLVRIPVVRVCRLDPTTGEEVCVALPARQTSIERIGFDQSRSVVAVASRPPMGHGARPSIFARVGEAATEKLEKIDIQWEDDPCEVRELVCVRYKQQAIIVVAAKEGSHGVVFFCPVGGDDKRDFLRLSHPQPVLFAAFNAGCSHLVTGAQDDKARVWSVEELLKASGKQGLSLQSEYDTVQPIKFEHTSDVVRASFGSKLEGDRWQLVTVSSEGEACVWTFSGQESADRQPPSRECILSHAGKITHAAFDETGKLVVTSSRDKTARIWEASSGRLVGILRHSLPVEEVRFEGSSHIITFCHPDSAELRRDAAAGEHLVHSEYTTYKWRLNVDRQTLPSILRPLTQVSSVPDLPDRVSILSSRAMPENGSRLEVLEIGEIGTRYRKLAVSR
jgi:WD40 repeat protein